MCHRWNQAGTTLSFTPTPCASHQSPTSEQCPLHSPNRRVLGKTSFSLAQRGCQRLCRGLLTRPDLLAVPVHVLSVISTTVPSFSHDAVGFLGCGRARSAVPLFLDFGSASSRVQPCLAKPKPGPRTLKSMKKTLLAGRSGTTLPLTKTTREFLSSGLTLFPAASILPTLVSGRFTPATCQMLLRTVPSLTFNRNSRFPVVDPPPHAPKADARPRLVCRCRLDVAADVWRQHALRGSWIDNGDATFHRGVCRLGRLRRPRSQLQQTRPFFFFRLSSMVLLALVVCGAFLAGILSKRQRWVKLDLLARLCRAPSRSFLPGLHCVDRAIALGAVFALTPTPARSSV